MRFWNIIRSKAAQNPPQSSSRKPAACARLLFYCLCYFFAPSSYEEKKTALKSIPNPLWTILFFFRSFYRIRRRERMYYFVSFFFLLRVYCFKRKSLVTVLVDEVRMDFRSRFNRLPNNVYRVHPLLNTSLITFTPPCQSEQCLKYLVFVFTAIRTTFVQRRRL